MLFADNLFDGESRVLHPKPSEQGSSVTIAIKLDKDAAVELNVKVMVGFRSSVQDHVFESTHRLPKFAAFELVKDPVGLQLPISVVTCHITERINRVALWINQSFTASVRSMSTCSSFSRVRDHMWGVRGGIVDLPLAHSHCGRATRCRSTTRPTH